MAYEEFPFNDAAAIEKAMKQSVLIEFESASFSLSTELLDNWHPHRATSFEDLPVVSEIPTLMASGGLDPITPVSNAAVALEHLKNGYGIVFPDESHDLFNPCFFQIAEEFFNDPSSKPDIECSVVKNPIEWNLTKPDPLKN